MNRVSIGRCAIALCLAVLLLKIGASFYVRQSGHTEQVAGFVVGTNGIHHIKPSGSAAS